MEWFNMGPFPCFVGYCDNSADFKRELRRLKTNPAIPFMARKTAVATCQSIPFNGAACIILCFRPHVATMPREEAAALAAHEATHAVQYMREAINQDEPFCHETEAYLVQYITQMCLNQLWQTGMTIRTRPVAP